jgi:MFS family permease
MDKIKKTLKDSGPVRWSALLMVSIIMFATYYFYDVFSAIKSTLQSEVGLTNIQYGSMVGAYSLANSFLLMAVLGGIILDKWGIRKTGYIFLFFVVLGSLTTAYGASDLFKPGAFGYSFMSSFLSRYSPELKMMLFGRFLFGLGCETIYVTINKVMVKWFKGKELAFAFGINLAIARFGTASALMFSPVLIGAKQGWTAAGWFGAMLVMISLLSFTVFTLIDSKYDRQIKKGLSEEKSDEFKLSDILALFKNPSFMFVTFLCVTFYSAVFPFLAFAPDLLQNKFGLSGELSGKITSILPFGTIVFTPLFGWYCDKKGKSASLMIFGSFLLILVHLTLSLTTLTPYIPMFVLGIAFSLVPAAMWPSVAKIVEEKRLGTAYGLMFFIQNFGLWGIPVLMGNVLDKTNPGITPEMVESGAAVYDYRWTVLMLVILGILGLFFAFLLKKEDKRSGYGLELPNKE